MVPSRYEIVPTSYLPSTVDYVPFWYSYEVDFVPGTIDHVPNSYHHDQSYLVRNCTYFVPKKVQITIKESMYSLY